MRAAHAWQIYNLHKNHRDLKKLRKQISFAETFILHLRTNVKKKNCSIFVSSKMAKTVFDLQNSSKPHFVFVSLNF